MVWALRTARPELKLRTIASDISKEILEFAKRGVYSLNDPTAAGATRGAISSDATWADQSVSIFHRLTQQEMHAMFELADDEARILAWLKEGISWVAADASRPELLEEFGSQDIVVANRFLCHMEASAAETCLRNIGRLVKDGGYLFVSGIDLAVRVKVAAELGWKPVEDLIQEVHEGDFSLHAGWPLHWWGLEPFSKDFSDWRLRYASVFKVGAT